MDSKVDDMTESLLLWTSFLFSEKVHFGGQMVSFLSFERYFSKSSEEQKINFFKQYVPGLIKTESSEQIDSFYKSLKHLRSIKHKSPKDIITIKKGERLINTYQNIVKKWIHNVLKSFHYLELLPFVKEDKELICWNIPISKKREHLNDEFFKFVNGALCIPEIMHYHFGESVREESILSTKLFEIPEPVSLSTSQVKIIRNDLLDKFKSFFDKIIEFNSSLKEIEYNKKNLKKLKKEYFDKACEEKNNLQDAIDNNLYMNQLKNKLEEDKTLSIHLGLASFNNILEFYKNAFIIDDYIILYLKDKMKEELNMKGSKFFLYLKTT